MSSLLSWRTSSPWPWIWLLLLTLYVTRSLADEHQPGKSNTCYYPDGSPSIGQSCHPKAENSACCSPGFTCLSNGACAIDPAIQKYLKYTYYRSSCTDRSWNDPLCPQFCVGPQDNRTAGHGLQWCAFEQHDLDKYCCRRDDVDCCLVPELVVHIGKGDPGLSFPRLNQPERASAHPANNAPAVEVSTDQARSFTKDTIVGLSVGFSLAIVIILSVCFVWIMRRRKRRRGKVREFNGVLGSKLSINKDMAVSVSALGETQSSIELQSVSTSGTRRTERGSRAGSVSVSRTPSTNLENMSRPHTRQRTDSRNNSVRLTESRTSSIRRNDSHERPQHRTTDRTRSHRTNSRDSHPLRRADSGGMDSLYRPRTPPEDESTPSVIIPGSSSRPG